MNKLYRYLKIRAISPNIGSILTTVVLLLGLNAKAQVVTYSFPKEVTCSDKYSVEVIYKGETKPAFTHLSECPRQTNPREKILPLLYDRTMSWTNISFDNGPVVVKVTKLYGTPANSVTISPKKYGIVADRFDGQSVVFTLNKPEYLSVRFNCDDNSDEYDQIRHGLMIFADELEKDAPDLNQPGVVTYSPKADLQNAQTIYFGPGVYNLVDDLPNGVLPLHDNQSVYIHGEAFIFGGISAPTTYNVKVSGRGILCGLKQQFHYPGLPQILELEPWNYRTNIHRGGHSTVTGITLLESFNHNMAVGLNSYVKDVKFIAWKVNNDGIRSGDGTVIDHVFMKVSDDHLYAFSNTLICNSIFWPMWNGAILQLGWGDYGGSGTRFVNNCIINPEWNQWWYNNGVLASQVNPDSKNSDILIQNLHIEGNINALANLHYGSRYDGKGPWHGYIKDITFRNVVLDGDFMWNNGQEGWYDVIPEDISFELSSKDAARRGRSLIRGYQNKAGEKAYVHHVAFENLKIKNQLVTDDNYKQYFDVDTATTPHISFIQTQNHDADLSYRPGYQKANEYVTTGIGAGSLNQDYEHPYMASSSGWIGKDSSLSWSINLPESGLYDIKVSVTSGLKDASFKILYGDGHETEEFKIKPITDNGYNLHKVVTQKPVQLKKGNNKLVLKGVKGLCLPDYIEISPSDGTIPNVNVEVTSVSVMKIKGDKWTGAKLNIGVRPDKLSFNSRTGVVINPDERGPSGQLPVSKVSIFNYAGEQQIQMQSNNLIRDIDISQLPFGPYTALFTDQKTFWIAKQVLK